ncbi:unnamed protein product [Arabis nemorensis]|uniref:Uncharacterized protein n=1 Tax=Arabis nemorensis TaxID=586526 RepID=A0A565BQW2_9BRAS|nr:unnamed protein product [Arabis nemorensis]
MELEKKFSILYKQSLPTQFSNKAARDIWLRKVIEDLNRVLDTNTVQVPKLLNEIRRLKKDLTCTDQEA